MSNDKHTKLERLKGWSKLWGLIAAGFFTWGTIGLVNNYQFPQPIAAVMGGGFVFSSLMSLVCFLRARRN